MNKMTYIETAEKELLHTYNRFQVVFDHGEGVCLYDTNGKEYLDFVSGIGVFALGYNNKEYNDCCNQWNQYSEVRSSSDNGLDKSRENT